MTIAGNTCVVDAVADAVSDGCSCSVSSVQSTLGSNRVRGAQRGRDGHGRGRGVGVDTGAMGTGEPRRAHIELNGHTNCVRRALVSCKNGT